MLQGHLQEMLSSMLETGSLRTAAGGATGMSLGQSPGFGASEQELTNNDKVE